MQESEKIRAVLPQSLLDVVFTLQYCLETFELACQCGRCDPCTRGQHDIRRAIERLEELDRDTRIAAGAAYRLGRESAIVHFTNREALTTFVREITPPSVILPANPTNSEIAAFAGRRHWTLFVSDTDEKLA